MENNTPRNVILRCEKICKSFPEVKANKEIDLEVLQGEVHTILGENGAGKTTLMNIIYGLYRPDSGRIIYQGKEVKIKSPEDAITIGIGMIHQHFALVPTLTVLENIILGKSPVRGVFVDYKKAGKIIQDLSECYGLHVERDAKIKDLPIGIRQRVEILKILYRGADTLIMDEPTAVLTPQETQKLFQSIREMVELGKTVIFISHKLDEVMEISDRITILRNGEKVLTLKKDETNKKELARLMVGREVLFRVPKEEVEKGEFILEVQQVHARNNIGLEKVRGISLKIRAGEILGIAGISGNGQRELADIITGLRPVISGKIHLQGRDITNCTPYRIRKLGVAHVPEDRRNLGSILDLNLTDNLVLDRFRLSPFSHLGLMHWKQIFQMAQKLLSEYYIRNVSEKTRAGSLSGGNLQRLILARELSSQHKLLVINKASRGLDVGSIEYVRKQIQAQKQSGIAVLLISEDLDEILDLSDRILVIYQGKIMGEVKSGEISREEIGLMMGGTHSKQISSSVKGKED